MIVDLFYDCKFTNAIYRPGIQNALHKQFNFLYILSYIQQLRLDKINLQQLQLTQQIFDSQKIQRKQARMNRHILSTPEAPSSQQKHLANTSSSIPDEECPYCLMKRKFNIGANTGDQKCFQHSLKGNLEVEGLGLGDEGASEDKNGFMDAGDMVDVLKEVEESLDYYWDNLKELSGGNPQHVHRDLEPVMSSLKRVQEKIGRFFFEAPSQVSEIKPISTFTTLHKKFYNSGSQKNLRIDLSIFDPQETTPTECIKQWVMHFHKIVQMRSLPEHTDPLPYECELEMRIFKQSMQRKFLAFADQIQGYERKIRDVLTKLIFYMEKCSETVSQKQIEEDILFIEGHQASEETREAELERLLVLQASSMEYMLFGNQR